VGALVVIATAWGVHLLGRGASLSDTKTGNPGN